MIGLLTYDGGDVWFFPPGVPHSIQAFDKGSDFLLVFDDVRFLSEEKSPSTHLQ